MTGVFEAGTPPARIPAVAALLAVEGRITRLAGRLTRLEPLDMTAAPATAMLDDPLPGLDVVLPHRKADRDGATEGHELRGEEGAGQVSRATPDRPGVGARSHPRTPGVEWAAPGLGRETLERPASGADASEASGWPGSRALSRERFVDAFDRTAHPGVPIPDHAERPAGAATPAAPTPSAEPEPGPGPGNGRVVAGDRNQGPVDPTSPSITKPVAGGHFPDPRPTAPAVQDSGAGRVNAAGTAHKGGLRVGTDPLAALTVLRANLTATPPQPGVTRGNTGPGPDTTHPARPAAPVGSSGPNAEPAHGGAAAHPAGRGEPGNEIPAPPPGGEPNEALVEALLDAMTDRLRLDMLRSYGSTED